MATDFKRNMETNGDLIEDIFFVSKDELEIMVEIFMVP